MRENVSSPAPSRSACHLPYAFCSLYHASADALRKGENYRSFNTSFLCFRPFWNAVGYKDQPRDQH